jgi:hypothetical protein
MARLRKASLNLVHSKFISIVPLSGALSLGGILALTGCSGQPSDETPANLPSAYAFRNLPSDFSVDLPESLTSNANTSASQPSGQRQVARSLKDVANQRSAQRQSLSEEGDPESTSSMGFAELQNIVGQMQMKKDEVAMNFVMADALFDEVQARCASSSSSCSIPAGELSLVFNEEMLTYINQTVSSGGENPDIEAVDPELSAMVGQTMPVPALTYTRVTGSSVYDHEIVVHDDAGGEGSTTTLRWTIERDKVQLIFAFDDPNFGSGFDSYVYDAATQSMSYTNRASIFGSNWNYVISIEQDPAKANANGVLFKGRSQSSWGADEYLMELEGVADDFGGYVKTTNSISTLTASLSSGADLIEPGTEYVILPTGGCAATGEKEPIGSIYKMEEVTYVALSVNLSGREVCEVSYDWDESGFSVSYGQPLEGVVINAGALQTESYSYSEGFDAKGNLKFAGFCSGHECDNMQWVMDPDSVDDSYLAYSDYYESAAEDGELVESAGSYSFSGSPQAKNIIIVLLGQTPTDENFGDVVIGQSWYNADTSQHEISVWGDVSAGASLFYEVYDEESFAISYTPATGISLQSN